MKYSIDDLEQDISRLVAHTAKIRKDRGQRYGKAYDTLANLRMSGGWRSAYVHAQECLNRIGNWAWVRPAKIKAKDFCNAAEDLFNYAAYIWIMFQHERTSNADTKNKKQP